MSENATRLNFVPVVFEKAKDPAIKSWERGMAGVRRFALRREPGGPANDPTSMSPDGTVAIVLSYSAGTLTGQFPDQLEIWDIRKEPVLRKFHSMPEAMNYGIRFSANGSKFASRSGNEILIFETATGERVGVWPLPPHALDQTYYSEPIPSDDGRTVVQLGKNAVFSVGRRLANDSWRTTILRGPSTFSAMNPFAASAAVWLAPDGRELLATRMEGKIYRWDLRATPGYERTWPSTLKRNGLICYAAMSRRGERVLYLPHTVILRKDLMPVGLLDPKSEVLRWGGFPTDDAVDGRLSLHPNGTRFSLTLNNLNGMKYERRWSLRKLEPVGPDGLDVAEVVGGPLESFSDFKPTESGRVIVEPLSTKMLAFSHSVFAGFQLRDSSDGAVKLSFRPAGDSTLCASPIVDPTDRFAANLSFPKPAAGTQSSIPTLRSFAIGSGKPNWEWTLPAAITVIVGNEGGSPTYSPSLPSIMYSPDGNRIALAVRQSDDTRLHVRVFDSATGKILRDLIEPPGGPVASNTADLIAFDNAGRIVVGDGRNAVVWNANDPEPKKLIGHEGYPTSACLSADGSRLFTLDLDSSGTREGRIIRVWDLQTGKEVIAIREPPPSAGGIASQWSDEMWLEGEKLMLMTSDGILVFDGTPR